MGGDFQQFTVMTLNAGGGMRAGDERLEPEKTAKGLSGVILKLGLFPDVIAVQESVEVHWTEGTTEGEKSAETADLLCSELRPELSEARYWSCFFECVDSDAHAHHNKWQPPKHEKKFEGYARAKEGNALIANKSIGEWPWDPPGPNYPGHGKRAPISTQIGGASLYSTGNRDTQPRKLIVVPVSIRPDASVYFMATHLATLTGEGRYDPSSPRSKQASDLRLVQVREILHVVDELRRAELAQVERNNKKLKHQPVILAGDFNAAPGSPEIVELERTFVRSPPRWHDKATQHGESLPSTFLWTHQKHKIHVDHIFFNDPDGLLAPVDCFVLGPDQVGEATDHLPVVATFKVKPRSQ